MSREDNSVYIITEKTTHTTHHTSLTSNINICLEGMFQSYMEILKCKSKMFPPFLYTLMKFFDFYNFFCGCIFLIESLPFEEMFKNFIFMTNLCLSVERLETLGSLQHN